MSCPVTYDARSEARNATSAPSSGGSPYRAAGIVRRWSARTSSSVLPSRSARPESDPLWQMLSAELGQPEIDELRRYLAGEVPHGEMGYGGLTIEPYDGRGGRSAIFIVRHEKFGTERVARAALSSILHDLAHHLRRQR